MGAEIRWEGRGEPVLFFPGWNTTAATVLSWMPEPILDRYRCGVVEWPGLGRAAGAALPEDLEGFLARLGGGLPAGPVPVVGFCMGGVAAWAFARRHPERVRATVLVESPLHFPAVLSPLLVPGLGRAMLRLAQGTRLGRHLVRRAILQRRVAYPQRFLDTLFAFDGAAAIHYLHLFRRYGRSLRGPQAAPRPCWRLVAQAPVRVMAPPLGRRHRIEATLLRLEGAGHFPAVEAPGPFFDCLTGVLDGLDHVGPEAASDGAARWRLGAAWQATPAPSPAPIVPAGPR